MGQRRMSLPPIVQHAQGDHWGLILPEARTNLITNPSFEVNTTGWTVLTAGTLATNSALSVFGGRSGQWSHAAASGLAGFYASAAGAAGVPYTFSGWLRAVTPGTNAISVSIEFINGASASIQTITQQVARGSLGDWTYFALTALAPAGTVTVRARVTSAQATAVSTTIYLDGAQLEQGAYATTYIDGDQPDCIWNGLAGASTSSRFDWSRKGGRIVSLRKFFGLSIAAAIGFSAPPQTVASVDSALGGGRYQRSVNRARDVAITGQFGTMSIGELHAARRALYEALSPSRTNPQQPCRLVYQQQVCNSDVITTKTVLIDAVYTGGLEGQETSDFGEAVTLTFRVHLPYVGISIGDTSLGLSGSQSLGSVAQRPRGSRTWTDLGQANNQITAGPVENTYNKFVYFAYADKLARMSPGGTPSVFASLDAPGDRIYSILPAPTGDVWVGGDLTGAGGNSFNHLMRVGVDGLLNSTGYPGDAIQAMAWARDGSLIVGAENALRRRNPAGTWSTLLDFSGGTMFSGEVQQKVTAVAVDAEGNIFAAVNVVSAASVTYNGVLWIPYANQVAGTWAVLPASSHSLSVDKKITHIVAEPGGGFWIAGKFTTVGGIAAIQVARVFDKDTMRSPSSVWLEATNTPTALGLSEDRATLYLGVDDLQKGYITASGRVFTGSALLQMNFATGYQWRDGYVYGLNTADTLDYPVGVLDSSTHGVIVGSAKAMSYPAAATMRSRSATRGDLTIKINGPGAVMFIRNETTGDVIEFNNLTLYSNETLTIKTGPGGYIRTNVNRPQDIMAFLTPGSRLTSFVVTNASNVISCVCTATLSGAYYSPIVDMIEQ